MSEPGLAPAKGRPRTVVWLELAAIVLFWSANWLITKAAFAYASPLAFTSMRFVCALVAMAAFSAITRQPFLPLAGERVGLGLIGLLQIGGMIGFGFTGLEYFGPGRAAVLIYTMPIWCIPLGWLLARERVSWSGLIGGATGLAGLILFLNPTAVNWSDGRVRIGTGLCLAGAISWALGASLYRRQSWRTGFWTQTYWQVLWTAVLVSPPLWIAGANRPVVWSAGLIAALAYNAVLATALCYWWWAKVLATTSAARAGQFLTLVPVCALLMSRAVTGEAVGLLAGAGVVLICAGVIVTLRGRNPGQAKVRSADPLEVPSR